MVELKPAKIIDFAKFAENLHPLNRDEIEACSGQDAETCLATLFNISSEYYVAEVNGKAACLYGIVGRGGYGEIWLIFAADVNIMPLGFFKASRKFVREKVSAYGRLEGHIKAGNYFAMRWAEWMGFMIDEAAPFGVKQKLFHKFHAGRGD